MCVNTMPWRKDIRNDLRRAINAAHQSGNGYKVKESEVVHYIISEKHPGKLQIFPGVNVPANSTHDRAMRKETAENQRVTSQSVQA